MPVAPRPLPDGLGPAFSCGDARAAGVSPKRLRAKDLAAPFRGVRTVPDAEAPASGIDPLARQREVRERTRRLASAYAEIMPAHAVFAGRTAAVLLGAPVDPGPDLVVAVPDPMRAPRRRGIRGVKVSRDLARTATVDHLRVTDPPSTWAMLGAELDVRELIIVGDAFVRVPRDLSGHRMPHARLATIDDLGAALAAGRRIGARKLRTALALIREGSASPLETDYRLDATAAGLPDADLDVDVRDHRGRLVGISEFVYPDFRTIVEIEGDHHRVDRAQWDRDIEKYAAYAALGWEVVRLTARHVRHRRTAVAIVDDVLRRRGWDGTRPR
ncbi:hypothetical protein [Microbacterium sp. NPDC077184]|uniref:hypothetical protein n=1 Tax=Microbacterium sp. NPDC077184 TaxID=3154764 RepID=UPI00341D4455